MSLLKFVNIIMRTSLTDSFFVLAPRVGFDSLRPQGRILFEQNKRKIKKELSDDSSLFYVFAQQF